MEKYNKKLEIVAYSLVIAMTLFTAAFVAYSYLSQPANRPSKIERGISIPTLDEAWDGYEKTVILVLSTKCRFCSENADFYQALVNKFGESDKIRIIAVLPQEKQESVDYLRQLGVKINSVKQAKLRDLQVNGTPTILLVGKDRKVLDSWVGKLDEKTQSDVMNVVGNF